MKTHIFQGDGDHREADDDAGGEGKINALTPVLGGGSNGSTSLHHSEGNARHAPSDFAFCMNCNAHREVAKYSPPLFCTPRDVGVFDGGGVYLSDGRYQVAGSEDCGGGGDDGYET